jgi:hypothetical protein
LPPARSLQSKIVADLAIACLIGIAVTHFADASDHFTEPRGWPWGVAFVLLSVASIALAVVLNRLWWSRWVWVAAAVIALVPMVGYVVTRALPVYGLIDHMGEWVDYLGIIAFACEALLLGLAAQSLKPAFTLAPMLNLVTVALLSFAVLSAASGYPVGTGCAAKVMVMTGGGHAEMDMANETKTQCVRQATAAQRAQAVRLWRTTWQVARTRFPTYEAARRAGYDYAIKPFDQQVSEATGLLHLTSKAALKDGRTLDPNAPESLAYQVLPDGRLSLVAFVYRQSSKLPAPPLGGPILKWHVHTSNGRIGRTMMAHVWLTPTFRTALAGEEPLQSLADARFPPAGRLAGVAGTPADRRSDRRPHDARVPELALTQPR